MSKKPGEADYSRNTEAAQADEEFCRQAQQPARGLWAELFEFFRHNKKWWLAPIVLVLLLVGLLIALAGTGAAPFIYTLF
jgi:hypothetical protein